MVRCLVVAVLAGLVLAQSAAADSITVRGQAHPDVFIRETGSLYYVHSLTDGSVFVVRKTDVAPGDVVMAADPAERTALKERWKASYLKSNPQYAAVKEIEVTLPGENREASAALAGSAPQGAAAGPVRSASLKGDPRVYQQWQSTTVTDGYVPYINLKNVAMRDALKALLRQLNLDYRIEGDIVYISSPELLRRESLEALETRYYEIASTANDTLPKIVVRNPQTQMGGFGGGFGNGGFGGNSGVGGQGGFGNSGFGGGGFGGQGGFGNGGFGGGMGNAGFGGGGFGGQGGFGGGGVGGGGMDVTSISNISQLFSNIDDRIVGETPAVIGPSFISSSRNTQQQGGAMSGGGGGMGARGR